MTIDEVTDAAELVKSVVDASANIIFGARIDPNVQDEVEITVIATSFPGYESKRDETPATRSYGGTPYYEPEPYQRRMTVNEPFYKPAQTIVAPPVERTSYAPPVQQIQPEQPAPVQSPVRQIEDDTAIERPAEKNIPKFAQLLRNLGKRRD